MNEGTRAPGSIGHVPSGTSPWGQRRSVVATAAFTTSAETEYYEQR